jgi:hypothetical protein
MEMVLGLFHFCQLSLQLPHRNSENTGCLTAISFSVIQNKGQMEIVVFFESAKFTSGGER